MSVFLQRMGLIMPAAEGGGGPGGPGGRTDIVIEGVDYKTGTINTYQMVVDFPAGYQVGDLILAFAVQDAGEDFTAPSTWLKGFHGWSVGSRVTVGMYYKFIDGSEGSSIIIESGLTKHSATMCFRISGASGLLNSGMAPSNDTTPNPPEVTADWEATDAETLWFSGIAWDWGDRAINSFSAGYGDLVTSGAKAAWSGQADMGLVTKFQSSPLTEDPSAWSLANHTNYNYQTAFTFGLEPGYGAMPAPGAHRYWRLLSRRGMRSNINGNDRIEFRTSVGGPSVTGSGTAIASSEESGKSAENAFDDTSSQWRSELTPTPHWIGYDFGAGNDVELVQIKMSCYNTVLYLEGMRDFNLEYSDDGSVWTIADRWLGNPPMIRALFKTFTCAWA